MAYARARYGVRSIGVASPECCDDCRCGPYCNGCPDSAKRGAVLPNRYLSFGAAEAESAGGIFGIPRAVGAVDAESAQSVFGDLKESLSSPSIKTAAGIAMTYHGYKRTGSILWALAYGLVGKTLPLVAVPIAIGQGFGKRKEGC